METQESNRGRREWLGGMPPQARCVTGGMRPECDPDRDNFALISSLVVYVRDALSGAPHEQVARRLDTVRGCVEAAKDARMLYPVIDAPLEDMISAVQATAAERRGDALFDAAIGACSRDAVQALQLPCEPPESVLNLLMREGGIAADRARVLYGALVGTFAKAK